MKYLMLFEAFESNALSKMMKFLKGKVDNNSKERFQNKLKTLIAQKDIPIDKIKDENVKYINRSQALKLRNKEDFEGDLYCLKFWFSMDEGYLGFTGTGNKTMDFKRYLEGGGRRRRNEQNIPFNDTELNYIKNTLDIKTGKLSPLKDYEDLKHGQLVIGIFSDDEDDLNRLGLAKIWRDRYDHLHAIQNITSGGTPDEYVDGVSWREWRNEDPKLIYSWSMGEVSSPGSDHNKLHIYTPSDEPIHVVGKKEVKEEDISSPFDFNLPVSRYYNLSEWGDTSWSIDDYTLVEKSDFAIVLMMDDILKSVETKVTDVKKSREETKEGATKLMSDSQIKKANIERYLTTLVGRMGIEKDIKELKNLQKLVIKSVCSDFAFISIYKGRPGFDNLDNLSSNLYEMMRSEDGNDRDYYLSNIISNFKSLNSYSDDYINQYNKSLKVINDSKSEELKELFKIFMEIGKKIKNYLLSQNIQSIEDLGMVLVRLKSIRSLTNERGLTFSFTRNVLGEFHYTSDVEYYINRIDGRENDILEDIKKAKHIERYVDSLLR
jgi:hypothetical protein